MSNQVISNKVNEKSIAKKVYINKKPWKKKLFILAMTLTVITSAILIWGYAFKGIIYLQTKAWIKNFYLDTAVKLNINKYIDSEKLTANGKKSYQRFVNDLTILYSDKTQRYRYLDSYYNIESNSGKEKNVVYYIITNNSFVDLRNHVSQAQKFNKSIFFKFVFTKYLSLQLDEILYRVSDLD